MSQSRPTPEEAQKTYHEQVMRAVYAKMAERGEFLHSGQVQLARSIFTEKKRVVQSQWGRSSGKTYCACFIAWVFALLNPNSQILIICPQRKQAKDIYWASNRLQKFGPEQYVQTFKESELRIIFKNGSVIALDGCENYEAQRGVKPHLVIYDEFQHHSKEFHLEVMQPNLTAKKANLVVLGTPPRADCYYVKFRKELLEEIQSGDTSRAYFEFPSDINPSLDKHELDKTRDRLIKSGDEKIWLREYQAKLIWGGEGAVFSPWDRKKHMKSHDVLESVVRRDERNLHWYTLLDPGNMSCFAVLFAAYNPYTSQIFYLDEIYETNPRNTDAKTIWEKILAKEQNLYPYHPVKTFRRIYDQAGSWFPINVKKMFPDSYMTPCEKTRIAHYNSREADTSLVKQVMATDNAFNVSYRCANFMWEIENYVVDEKGEFPRHNDHLIDCLWPETVVDTIDGPKKLINLVGTDGYVYSRNGTVQKFFNVIKTHSNIEVVKVCFKDGRSVICTPNHKFLATNNEFIEASCLSMGILIQRHTYGSKNNSETAYPYSFFSRKEGCCTQAHARESNSSSKGVAFYRRGLSLAFSTFKENVAKYAQNNKGLLAVWKGISSVCKPSRFCKILSCKLLGKSLSATAEVEKVIPWGVSDTYCMEVKNTHCFSVNEGIIVHNCSIYGLKAMNFKFIEGVPAVGQVTLGVDPRNEKPVHIRQDVNGEDWADNIVDDALNLRSIYDEYFL